MHLSFWALQEGFKRLAISEWGEHLGVKPFSADVKCAVKHAYQLLQYLRASDRF